jgi:hypothetical protein
MSACPILRFAGGSDHSIGSSKTISFSVTRMFLALGLLRLCRWSEKQVTKDYHEDEMQQVKSLEGRNVGEPDGDLCGMRFLL